MSIGKRIAQLRKNHGFTQEQLADLLGTTRQAVSKWESDKTNPDISYIVGLSKLFGTSTDYILLGSEPSDCCRNVQRGSGCEPANSMPKRPMAVFYLFLVTGILVLLFCPLFATVYRNYMSQYGPAYTDPYWYLQEWPLVGVKIAGILSLITGVMGIFSSALHNFFQEMS